MSTKRKRRAGPGKRMGRPPRPDAGNYVHAGFGLRTDLMIYARGKAARESRSLSSALNHLVEQGIAAEKFREEALARAQQQPADSTRPG